MLRARSTPSRSSSRACGPLVRAAHGCAQVDDGARVLEPGFRACEHLDRLPEQHDSCLAALGQTERAQGGADGTRVTPASSERQLLLGERTRFVVPGRDIGGLRRPSCATARCLDCRADEPSGLADLEQLLDSPLGASDLDAQTAAVEPKVHRVDLVERELLREVTLVDHARRLVGVPLLEQRLRQEPDVVGPRDQQAVRDAEIERLPQIRDGGSKIAVIRLPPAAP